MKRIHPVIKNKSDSDDELDDVLGLFSGNHYEAVEAKKRLRKAKYQREKQKQNEAKNLNQQIESRKEYNGKNYYHQPQHQTTITVSRNGTNIRANRDPLYGTLKDGMVPSLPPPPPEMYPDFTEGIPESRAEIEEPFNPKAPPPQLRPETKSAVGTAYGIQVDVPKAPIPTKFVSAGSKRQNQIINPTPYMPYDYQLQQYNQYISPGMSIGEQNGYVGPPIPVDMIYRRDDSQPFYPEGYPLGPFHYGDHPPPIGQGPYQETYLEPQKSQFDPSNRNVPIENDGIVISSPNMAFNYQYNVKSQQRLSASSGIQITPREKTWVQPAQMNAGNKIFTATTGTTKLPEKVPTSLGVLTIGKSKVNPNQFKLEVPHRGGINIEIGHTQSQETKQEEAEKNE